MLVNQKKSHLNIKSSTLSATKTESRHATSIHLAKNKPTVKETCKPIVTLFINEGKQDERKKKTITQS